MDELPETDTGLGSDSDSSVNDFDFSNDSAMLADLESPGILSPGAAGAVAGIENFPLKEFSNVIEGLNRLPSWIVFPVDLAKCLKAAARILSDRQRASAQDLELVRRLIREAVPSTLEKCLDDAALCKWNNEIHCNIFEAVSQMMDVLVLKLQLLKQEEIDVEAEEDLIQLLKTLSIAFDYSCHFHEHHIRDPLPSEIEVDFSYAESLLVPPAENDMQEDAQPQEGHFWLAAMLTAMAQRHGFQALEEVLQSPEHLSVNLLRHVLMPISTAARPLTDTVLESFVEVCERLLAHISELLETDVEELSMRGADKTYSCTSQLLGQIFEILMRRDGATQANKKVGEVQKQFVSKMLSFSNFNKHLSAVREILKLLKRSHELKGDEGGFLLTANLEWLNSEGIMKAMLRGNLHQKQYVDQVQKILQYLLQEGCMRLEHLDILWSVTEKADTFETVKSNVYNLLVALAFDFSAKQLDFLFDKFESAKDSPAADTVKIAQLLCKIAEADVEAVMADRLVGILWDIVTTPDAPKEVLFSGILADVAILYKGRDTPNILDGLCLRCLGLIKEGSEDAALRGLFLLRQLVSKAPQPKGHDEGAEQEAGCARRLMEEHRTSELILTSIESFVQMHGARRAAQGTPGPSKDDPTSTARIQGLRERVQTLLLLGKISATCLQWDVVDRMWTCLVSNSVTPEDRQLGYLVFLEMMPTENSADQIIDAESARKIVSEKFPGQPAQDLCEAGFKCFHCCFFVVGFADRKVIQVPEGSPVTEDLDLSGMDYLWAVATRARRQGVASQACSTLIKLHSSLGDGLKDQAGSIQRTMIEDVLASLLKASGMMLKAEKEDAELPHILADEDSMILSPRPVAMTEGDLQQASFCALRCIEALLLILERCSPRSMPRMPSHSAACCKTMQRLEVTIPNWAAASSPRFVYRAGTSEYVGRLRRAVAARLKVPPERVRLLTAGHELNSDAEQLAQVGIGDGQIVNVAVSEVSNSYSGIESESGPDATPVGIIASRTEIFDALLGLADLPQVLWEVQHSAIELLHVLPTQPAVPKSIAEALTFEQPRKALEQLLAQSGPITSTRLVYFVEALAALLCPPPRYNLSQGSVPSQEKLLTLFVESGGLEVLLSPSGIGIQDEVARLVSGESCGEVGYRRQLLSKGLYASIMLLKYILCPPKTAEQQPRVFELQDTGMELAIHHLLGAIWIAGRTWLPEINTHELSELEHRVVHEALRVLTGMVNLQPQVVKSIVKYPIIKRLIVENLLNSRSCIVRASAVPGFCQMFCTHESSALPVDDGTGQPVMPASRWFLRVLIGARQSADELPTGCTEYFQALIACLKTAQDPQAEATELLASEISALEAARPPQGEADRRLPGQLHLVRELVRTLQLHGCGTGSHSRMVNLLISKLLFPEAVTLQHIARLGNGMAPDEEFMDPANITRSLHAPCNSQKIRCVALEVLCEIMTGDSASLAEGVQLLMDLHFSQEPHFEWEHQPTFYRRASQRFCGLKNAGATCYMNATIQQLFMTTGLRSLLLECDDIPDDHKADSVLHQLQVMFAHLALSTLEFYIPQHFWHAFKDYDGEPINLREHQDAFEFLTRLQDLVDQGLSDTRQLQVMKSTMGGKFAQQVICRGVSYRSETEQDFMGISVDVRGKRNLLESLNSYVQGELMEGENAYFCEEIGRKVDAVKRACVKTLPDTLVIHLKRFEFDFDTMLRSKIRDRFEFPNELNMYEYTVEGLAEAEGQKMTDAMRPPEYYQYELVGIVVHSGTAFVGHYYSYIKERQKPGAESCTSSKDGWWVFDDNSVQPWDAINMDRDCFGGKSTVDVFDSATQQHVMQEFDRPNSAYLLVYERSEPYGEKSPIASGDAAGPSPVDPDAEAPSSLSDPSASGTTTDDTTTSTSQAKEGGAPARPALKPPATSSRAGGAAVKCVELEVPAIGKLSIQSDIYKNVTLDNLWMINDMHRLDGDYFHFIRHLVDLHAEQLQAEPSQRKLRRTEPPTTTGALPDGASGPLPADADLTSPSTSISAELSGSRISEPQSEHSDRIAVTAMRLACSFLLKLYFRAHSSLRDDIPSWKATMTHLMEASASANLAFMLMVSGEADEGSPGSAAAGDAKLGHAIGRFLLMCPSSAVRQMFGQLIAASIKAALQQGAVLDAGSADSAAPQLTQAAKVLVYRVAVFVHEVVRSNSLKIPVNELLFLLHEIALMGPGPTRFLMSLNGLISQMVELLTGRYSFYSNNPEACDLSPLISCLSRFIRLCTALEKQGDNPYLLLKPAGDEEATVEVPPSGRVDLAPEVAKMLVERTAVCLVDNLQLAGVVDTLCAISYNNPQCSYDVLLSLLERIQRLDAEDLCLLADNIGRLIAMPDQFQQARMVMFLNPSESNLNVLTLNEQLLDDPVAPSKRFALLKVVLAVADATTPEKFQQVVNANTLASKEWKEALEWLEQLLEDLSSAQANPDDTDDEPKLQHMEDDLQQLRELLA